jgi:hypothetical protein
MSNSRRCILTVRFLGILLAIVFTCLLSGCATTADESDLPWNVPQSWEGSPSLPGMQQ